MRPGGVLLLAAGLCLAPLGHAVETTAELLQRQTQEMMDAVGAGTRAVWDRYLLPASKLDEYVGVYELTPEVKYSITRDADGLVGQRSGRKPDALKAETPDGFFVPGQPRGHRLEADPLTD